MLLGKAVEFEGDAGIVGVWISLLVFKLHFGEVLGLNCASGVRVGHCTKDIVTYEALIICHLGSSEDL